MLHCEIEGIDEIVEYITKMEDNVKNLNKGTVRRGERFMEYVKKNVKEGALGLKKDSRATEKIQGSQHAPMDHTGTLLGGMKLQTDWRHITSVGYFDDGSRAAGYSLTYLTLVVLHHTGYKIPLSGVNGEKVRGFLARHGVFPSKTKNALYVPARPFFDNAVEKYDANDEDAKGIGEDIEGRND